MSANPNESEKKKDDIIDDIVRKGKERVGA